jgi:microcystin-dependent protein
VGTTYGGDGKSTFALPNFQGRAPLHPGAGPGLTARVLGETDGTDAVTLLANEIPIHGHSLNANSNPADLTTPTANRSLARSSGGFAYQDSNANLGSLAPEALAAAGGSLPHNNLMPYLVCNFCIALQGVFPPRS